MIFKNYSGGVDVYMHVSSWAPDLWSFYQIDDQAMPEDWHKTRAMRWISNDIWPMDDLPDKKRKCDAMGEDAEEEAMTGDEEATMMHDVCVYKTAMAAMTPTMHTATTSPTSEEEAMSGFAMGSDDTPFPT